MACNLATPYLGRKPKVRVATTNISKHGFEVQNTKKKIPNTIYELEITLENKVYPKTYYRHQPGSVIVDETPTNIKAQGL